MQMTTVGFGSEVRDCPVAGANPTNQPWDGVPGPRLAVPVLPATGTRPREAGPAMPKEAESARPERTTWDACESGCCAI